MLGFHAESTEPLGAFFKAGKPESSSDSLIDSLSTLQGDPEAVLKHDLVLWGKAGEEFGFVVSGYTDAKECRGKDCDDLSLRRAELVRNWLVSSGVDSRRVKPAIGYGDKRPIESNETEGGRARNRRVSIDLFSIP